MTAPASGETSSAPVAITTASNSSSASAGVPRRSVDAGGGEPVGVEVEQRRPSRAVRRGRRDRQLAADPVRRLEQHDVLDSRAREAERALEAGGAGADHGHSPGPAGLVAQDERRAAGGAVSPGGARSGLTVQSSSGSNVRQSSLQATHGRTSAARPLSTLRGRSGSAISARAMPTRSAPPASASAIASASRNACDAISGFVTSGRSRASSSSSGGRSVAMSRT